MGVNERDAGEKVKLQGVETFFIKPRHTQTIKS